MAIPETPSAEAQGAIILDLFRKNNFKEEVIPCALVLFIALRLVHPEKGSVRCMHQRTSKIKSDRNSDLQQQATIEEEPAVKEEFGVKPERDINPDLETKPKPDTTYQTPVKQQRRPIRRTLSPKQVAYRRCKAPIASHELCASLIHLFAIARDPALIGEDLPMKLYNDVASHFLCHTHREMGTHVEGLALRLQVGIEQHREFFPSALVTSEQIMEALAWLRESGACS